jgi:predicted site-specific integrase-resolvase
MKLLLTEWAAKHYSPPPSLFTLRRWARDGEIWPPPEKVGKHWMVDEAATRRAHNSTPLDLVQRLQSA